jgi:uncharacterized membrane protein YidH (DUF202 family)
MDQRSYADGAQFERTVLSWNRSGLAIAANGGLLIREGVSSETPAIWVCGLLVLAVGVAISCLTISGRIYRAERRVDHVITGHPLGAVAATLFIAALSIADLVLVVA